MNRKNLLEDKPKKRRTQEHIAYLTNYNRNYKLFKCIVNKHWPILLRDKALLNIIPSHPQFIYCRVPNLRNRLALNIHDPPMLHFWTRLAATIVESKACKTTRNNKRKIDKFKSLHMGREYTIKKFITCKTTHVTYLITCPCGLQYVGCTTRN